MYEILLHVLNPIDGLNEFQKRAQFITGSCYSHIFEPLMKRCLDEQPVARGTFDDVQKDLSVHQSNYSGKQAHELEERIVRHLSLGHTSMHTLH